MPFLRPLCGECSNNINIMKWREYFLLGVTYHQVIEPQIVDLVGNNYFLRAYEVFVSCNLILCCHTPSFDLRPCIHMSFNPDQSLTFQWKIRQRGILNYLIFCSDSGPLHSLFYFNFKFHLLLTFILLFKSSYFFIFLF